MALLRDQQYKESLTWKSSFASVPKVLEAVIRRFLANERLKKLLYYSDPNALSMPKLTGAQSMGLLGESIMIVPKLKVAPDTKPYILINLDQFVPNQGQTEFRQVSLSIDVLCVFDQWNMGDFQLRPYLIAGEIDGMVNKTSIFTGLANFVGAKQLMLNEHIGGISLYYTLQTLGEDTSSSLSDSEVESMLDGILR